MVTLSNIILNRSGTHGLTLFLTLYYWMWFRSIIYYWDQYEISSNNWSIKNKVSKQHFVIISGIMDTGAWCFSNQHHLHQFTSVLNFWTPGVGLVGEYLGHLILEQKPRLKSEYCITVTQLVADNCDKKTTKRKTKLFFPHDITVQFSCIFFIYNSIYELLAKWA